MNNNYIDSRIDKIHSQFYYVLVIEDEHSRKTIVLEEANYSLGRDNRNKIVLESKKVSRFHATLLRRTSPDNKSFSYWILDGDLQGNRSTNGIFINDKRCLVQELKHEDNIRLGLAIKMNYYVLDDMSELALLQSGDFDDKADYDTTDNLANTSDPSVKDKSTKMMDTNSTIMVEDPSLELLLDEELDILEVESEVETEKLASFPKLTPNPVLEMDWNGKITYLNPIANRLFPELKNKNSWTNHPFLEDLLKNLETNSRSRQLLHRQVKFQDKLFDQYIHYLHEQKLIRSYIFERTEINSYSDSVSESEAKYNNLLKQNKDGVLVIDADSKKIIDVNPSFNNLLSYNTGELSELTLYDVIALDQEELDQQIDDIVSSNSDNYLLKHFRYKCKNESCMELESTISCLRLQHQTLISILARPLLEKNYQDTYFQAEGFYDLCTGLPSRQLLLEQLRLVIANSFRNEHLVSFLLIELEILDKEGNKLENQLTSKILEGFAKRLKACLRSGDIIAYWESSQFACLLPQVQTSKDVGRICNRLLQSLHQQLLLDERKVRPTIKIGIALKRNQEKTIDVLINEAQNALLKSKKIADNNYHFADEQLQTQTKRLLRIENLLVHALERQEFSLVYQPQIDIPEHKITGIEVFIRWKHPELGIVNPGEFLTLAEETGLIVSIGEWVIRTACQQRKRWEEYQLSDQPICVNISSEQFQQNNFVQLLRDILAETELEPHLLELELKESAIAMNMELSKKYLTELNQMGVRISLDDFGTGISSFGYLKQFQFATLKIDRPTVNDITSNSQDKALVGAVLQIAQSATSNLRVVAEGVENQEKVDELLKLGCAEIQGNWLTAPLKENKIIDFLVESEYNL